MSDTKQVCFKLSPVILDRAKTAAEVEGRSLSNWITRLITLELSRLAQAYDDDKEYRLKVQQRHQIDTEDAIYPTKIGD